MYVIEKYLAEIKQKKLIMINKRKSWFLKFYNVKFQKYFNVHNNAECGILLLLKRNVTIDTLLI